MGRLRDFLMETSYFRYSLTEVVSHSNGVTKEGWAGCLRVEVVIKFLSPHKGCVRLSDNDDDDLIYHSVFSYFDVSSSNQHNEWGRNGVLRMEAVWSLISPHKGRRSRRKNRRGFSFLFFICFSVYGHNGWEGITIDAMASISYAWFRQRLLFFR